MRLSSLQNQRPLKLVLLLILSLLPLTSPFAEEPRQPKIQDKAVDGRLEVIKVKLNGYFIDIQFRMHGESGNKNSEDSSKNVYVIEEFLGEKFFARRYTRTGTLGQKRMGEGIISFVRIENAGMKIKKNSRITLVVGALRQEHIVVEE